MSLHWGPGIGRSRPAHGNRMSTAASEHPAAGSPQFVDFDEFIDFQLRKTRAGIRAADLLSAAVGLSLAFLAYLLAFVILDQWVIEGGFAYGTRVGMLGLFLLSAIAWVVWKIVLPAQRRVSTLYAARELELSQPELRSNLLNLVDLQQAGRPVSPQILEVMGRHAARTLSRTNVEEAIDRRPLMRMSWALLGVLVLMALYVMFSPKKMSSSVWRALLPMRDMAVATRTHIDRVDPGDTAVLARSQLPVSVDLSGELPAEVQLLFTTADRRFVDEPLQMRAVDNAVNRFRGTLVGDRGQGLLQNLTYRIKAGDAISRSYSVQISQPPSATVQEVRYRYPDYMNLPSRTDAEGTIDAWEGTRVTVNATANMPVVSAKILYSDSEDLSLKAEEFLMTVRDGTQLSGELPLQFRNDGSAPQFYRIQVKTQSGDVDPQPVLYSLRIRPDLPPKIALHHPEGNVRVPANGVVPIAFRARDPDFLLQSVVLMYQKEGDEQPRSLVLYESPPPESVVETTYRLPLEALPLQLRSGDRVTCWLQARDNLVPFGSRGPNITRSETRTIKIGDAATPEQVAEQYEQQQQQAEQRLEETRREETGRSDAESEPTPEADTPHDPSTNDSPMPAEKKPGDESSGEPQAAPSKTDSPQNGAQKGSEGETDRQPDRPMPDANKDRGSDGSPKADGGKGTEPAPADGNREDGNPFLSDNPGTRRPQSADNTPMTSGSDSPNPDEQPRSPANGEQTSPGRSDAKDSANDDRNAQKPQADSGPRDRVSDERLLEELLRRQQEQRQASKDSAAGESASRGESSDNNGTQGKGQDNPEPDSANSNRSDTSNDSMKGDSATGATPSQPTEPKPAGNDAAANDQRPGQGDAKDPASSASPSKARNGTPPNEPSSKGREGDGPPMPEAPMSATGKGTGDTSSAPAPNQRSPEDRSSNGEKGPSQPSADQKTGRGDPSPRDGMPPSGSEDDGRPAPSQEQPGNSPKATGDATGKPMSPDGKDSATSDNDQPGGGGAGNDPSPGKSMNRPTDGDSATPEGDPASSNGTPSTATPGKPNDTQGGTTNPSSRSTDPNQGDPTGRRPRDGSDPATAQPTDEQNNDRPFRGDRTGGDPPPKTEPSQGKPESRDLPDGNPTGGNPDEYANDPAGTTYGRFRPGMQYRRGRPLPIPTQEELEAPREKVNLVLKDLRNQLDRGELDPNLMRELGVTEQDLHDFARRLEDRLADTGEETTPEALDRRRQFEEMLRGIDYRSSGERRDGSTRPREAAGGAAGIRRETPAEYREQERKYLERRTGQRP